MATPPTQLRWDPLPLPTAQLISSPAWSLAGNGDTAMQAGIGVHVYARRSMHGRYFTTRTASCFSSRGRAAAGNQARPVEVKPGEIALLPRGIAAGRPPEGRRGYVCENYGPHFRLPELGPIGANGLANARDFLAPVAAFEDREGDFELVAKFAGGLWSAPIDHSPLDVVAWHGNHAPYKYDLTRFNTVNTVSFDHPDPSIFTVLTSYRHAGTANVDP